MLPLSVDFFSLLLVTIVSRICSPLADDRSIFSLSSGKRICLTFLGVKGGIVHSVFLLVFDWGIRGESAAVVRKNFFSSSLSCVCGCRVEGVSIAIQMQNDDEISVLTLDLSLLFFRG